MLHRGARFRHSLPHEPVSPIRHQYGAWRRLYESLASRPMSAQSNSQAAQASAILAWLREREDEMARLLAGLVPFLQRIRRGRIIARAQICSRFECASSAWIASA